MIRSALIGFFMSAVATAAPVWAQSSADCAIFGQIAEQAAQARLADTEMMEAMVAIAEGYTGVQERFRGAVPVLVDWVWSLEEAQLSQGVGASYRAACEAQ